MMIFMLERRFPCGQSFDQITLKPRMVLGAVSTIVYAPGKTKGDKQAHGLVDP